MKKFLLATTIGLAAATAAQAEPVFFSQLDLGMSSLRFHDGDHFNKNVFSQRISGGLDFQDGNRVALDVTRYGRVKDNYSDMFSSDSLKFDAYGVGLSYTYLFPVNFPVRPYVGGRIGMTIGKTKVEYRSMGYYESDSDTKTRFSFGGLAGIEYNITPRITVGLGAEYSRLASDLNSINGSGFLRYTF